MGQRYSVIFSKVSVTAQQDFFELNVASTRSVRILSCVISQSSDAGDAADEQLAVLIGRGHATSGSGGSAATPSALASGGAASASSAEINNTTIASTGTLVTLVADAFNVRAGWVYKPIPEEMIELAPSSRLVVRLLTTPADALEMSGTLTFEELGG